MLARKIVWMMGGAITLTVVMVLATVLWTAAQNNAQAKIDSRRMIEGAIRAEIAALDMLARDYAYWDAALEHAVARDVAWLHDNMGIAAGDGPFDIIQIVWPEDGAVLSWPGTPDGGAGTTPLLPRDMAERVGARLGVRSFSEREPEIFGVAIDGRIFAVAAARIQNWEDAPGIDPAHLPLMFMGIRLDPARLDTLGQNYLVEDLALLAAVPERGLTTPLPGLDGTPVAHFAWSAPRPGDRLIRAALLPLSLALALFLVLSVTVTVLARGSARELVRREAQSAVIARTDPLTGLPNRMAFNETVTSLRRHQGEIATLVMDVNDFKAVNDMHGADVGDALVAALAAELIALVPADCHIARVGGDEFHAVFTGDGAAAACRSYCAAVRHRPSAHVTAAGIAVPVQVAIGCAAGGREHHVAELVRRAEIAMYEAKGARTATVVEYHPCIEADAKRDEQIRFALEAALDHPAEFEVHYQPIFDARTGRMRLAEALIRWTSPTLGRVSPARFIPVAEASGMVVDIGRIVLDRVCGDLARAPGLHVSVNLSPAELKSAALLDDVAATLARHGVEPSRIEFELTETLLADAPDLAACALAALRARGHPIAIDDFGSGFASIGYLRRFSFTKLKVDKSFVDDIGVKDGAVSLLRALLFLSRALDLTIVAEGVETEAQFDCLTGLEYDLIQGYFLGRPVPFRELSAGRLRAISPPAGLLAVRAA